MVRFASLPLAESLSGDLTEAALAATSLQTEFPREETSRLDVRLLLAVVELIAGSVLPDDDGGELSTVAEELLGGSPAGGPRQDLGRDLFLGSPGTALFLAAYARATGDARCRELCLASLAASRAALLAGRPSLPALPVGALVGVSAAIHASLLAGVLLDEPALFGAAHELTELLTPAVIRADRHLDVVFGSAGALLVLLALDRVAGEPNRAGRTPLHLALECGAHLLASRAGGAGFPRVWETSPGEPPRSGFSHGASGICLALARLHARTGDPAFWHAVLEGAAAERRLEGFLPDQEDGSPGSVLHRVSWCHGAAGILLSRLGILAAATPREGREALARDLARALTVTLETRQVHLDHLCCGNLGRVEAWLSLHQAGGDPALLSRAHALALRVLRGLKKRGSFALDVPAAEASFFRGLPGIGYALLRLIDPSSLPCLLLVDDPFFKPLGGTESHASHAQAAPDRQRLL